MNSFDRGRVPLRDRVSLLVLLASGFLVAGCVGLTKPQSVRDCENTSTGCLDKQPPPGHPGPDVAEDTATPPSPDLGNEPATAKPDAAPDNAPPSPDSPLDTADAGSGKDDVLPDTRPPSDGVADVAANDLPVEKTTGPEPGPEPPAAEPGAEPGPERGPEPGAEPGPEPGPEPGKEPGPEPGPEPPPDGGRAACANATPFGGSTGTVIFQTTGAYCFVTCNAIASWGCSNFDQTIRAVTVNGTSVNCAAGLPAKKSGYYYFEIAANATAGHTYDAIWFSGTAATSCTAPAGGYTP